MTCRPRSPSGTVRNRVFPTIFPLIREARRTRRSVALRGWSTLQLHAPLHTWPRTDPLAPSGDILEAGAVDQCLAPGVDRVEAEIGNGDVIAGQIRRAGELIVGGVELGDEPVLVKLDRRWRHLLRHAVAEKEDVLRGRRHVAGGFAEPLVGPGARQGIAGDQLAGLLGEVIEDRPRLDQGQRPAAGTLGIDQGRNPGGRVYFEIIRLFLVALRQVENVHRARDTALVDRDRRALPIAGAGRVEFHRYPLVCLVVATPLS